ncbi:sugar ABC transporter permease [Defluviitalea raffinosedens]|uniref:sugar ABC transporter permease n=1 Tax=Defluviitalea raffinosedens TaxID=1450156 RepID=UPI001753375F|nr:sugar ABC transporter permease [Defluviitalea raffinosedens]MBM7685466.1 arabinogalactan oligomer/maltooligosaccharide transport system permease protein [Defluviitalea raffinosedens]HHW66226.1 sugar ABC transporter permease [Candidatus Epulonipiscium sp.]
MDKVKKHRRKMSTKERIKDILAYIGIYTVLIVTAIAILYPVVWVIGASFNQGSSLASATAIPSHPTLNNYKRLFAETDYERWYLNTLAIAVVNMVVSVVLVGTMGYVFARLKFAGKKVGLLTILILQMFPSFMGMIAIYVLFLNFGLLNQPLALVLIYSAGQIPYNTWLIKGYLKNVSKSMDEAAMIDGASKLQIYTKIILPLMFPILTFVAITQFMAPWFDYILPSFLISSTHKKTLAIGLYDLINSQTNKNFTMFAAGAVLVAVPITILYLFLQRYLIEGLSAGANKE